MGDGDKQEIPAMVTENPSPTPVILADRDEEFVPLVLPTDYSMLSSGILRPGRWSVDALADEDGLSPIPPTLSTQPSSPARFASSPALRESKPGDRTNSLALLSPNGTTHSRSRRPSNATVTSTEGTVADSSPGISHLYTATSNITTSAVSAVVTLNSPMPTHFGSTSDIGGFVGRIEAHEKARNRVRSGVQGTAEEGDNDDRGKAVELDLAQDAHIDPTPFRFRSHRLASLIEAKDLDALEAMGGITGLLAGLGVNPTCGLCISGKAPRSEEAPGSEKGDDMERYTHEGPPFCGSVEDRRRVYGSNVLPVRKSVTLLELMWLALKDRVLVSHTRFPKSI